MPRNRFTVVTGVSGSGKSTLAFDIVFGEGQRRYLESLNAYARQFVQPASRPDVDAIFGIPPTVAIEQRTSRGGRKSTVATLTEIYHFLRLLYVKLGTQYCPDCDVPIEPQSFESIAARMLQDYRGKQHRRCWRRWSWRARVTTPTWPRGRRRRATRTCASTARLLPTDSWPRLSRFQEHTIELPVATLAVSPRAERELRAALTTALDFGKGVVHCGRAARTASDGDARRARCDLLDATRLSVVRAQLRRARSAPVLVQLQARLVRGVFRHRPEDARLRRGAERRGDLVERVVRGRRRGRARHATASG